jgi:hypothetical protein
MSRRICTSRRQAFGVTPTLPRNALVKDANEWKPHLQAMFLLVLSLGVNIFLACSSRQRKISAVCTPLQDDGSLQVEGLSGHLDDHWRHGLKPSDYKVQ